MRVPRLVVAGTNSGVGKTSLTLSLVCALRRRGLRVQTFKVGPDYLDPTYLQIASGRPCYNLDLWMTGRDYVRGLLARAAAGGPTAPPADICIVEGVMGLFDGARSTSSEGSTADVASLIQAPVVLVVNAHGTARSLCAVIQGFREFEQPRGPLVQGILLNRCGSESHKALLADALGSAGLSDALLGAFARDGLPDLPSRHLGLVTADEEILREEHLEALADACERSVDVDALVALARSAPPLPAPVPLLPPAESSRARIGLARDEAFHFYYPDNLEALESCGADLVPFSPLACPALPADLDALYIGGGYPEEHAAALSANGSLCAAVRSFAESGKPVYAECGGLMYLARALTTLDGRTHPMAGVLPFSTRMLSRRKMLGYAEATLREEGLWGPPGTQIRGHEYHYSEIDDPEPLGDGWRTVYDLRRRARGTPAVEGYARGAVLASYLHVHLASNPGALQSFLSHCEGTR